MKQFLFFYFLLFTRAFHKTVKLKSQYQKTTKSFELANDLVPFHNENVADRRVFRLISKVNETLEADDILSPIWEAIRYESLTISENDLQASAVLSNSILSHSSLEEAIISFIANELDTPLLQATQVRNIFSETCAQNKSIAPAWALDLLTCAMNDNSLPNSVSALLFNKGFHALATYRVANTLWQSGRDGLARYFQSLGSRVFSSDIHPACSIGKSILIPSGSDVVIGETASVGDDCVIMHGVTLGGTGKESGDRHPKVGTGVFIGCGSTVLGNIQIGDGSLINAGSVVTKPVEAFTRVGGVPARFINRFKGVRVDLNEMSEKYYYEEILSDLEIREVTDIKKAILSNSVSPPLRTNYHGKITGK